ncbi:MAG: 3-oxoacyl-ACP synthase III [Desulfobulbaceae bacterium]|uniref:3-oxoacyl-ACP synthase III n=1 Tax=Candidatus Desulfobia pelagia TaxID=2841692 RepID=A0A8J6NED8_9BACT|nr:3-oxoacyl-ACP synthase III [Candidatus Desulfobia pelagia]
MHYSHISLYPLAYQLPPLVVTSDDIERQLEPVYRRLKLPAGRLELMSGIKERRFWDKGTLPSQGAAMAGKKALIAAETDPGEIDCLIFTSVSRDMMEPATAAFVHRQLGLPERCQIFDISNACLGFLNGMIVLANMIELGQVKKGLIVAGETAEELVATTIDHLVADDTLTRKTIKSSFASLTIGSGAVAMVMGDNRLHDTGHTLLGGVCRANTSQNDLCHGGKDGLQGTLMATDSEELLKQGVATAAQTWSDFKNVMGKDAENIDRFFCHQVGKAHAQLLFEALALNPEKNFETLPFLGNVGSVSAPVTMAIGIEQEAILPGQKAALLGIGSGINCLMLGIQW